METTERQIKAILANPYLSYEEAAIKVVNSLTRDLRPWVNSLPEQYVDRFNSAIALLQEIEVR